MLLDRVIDAKRISHTVFINLLKIIATVIGVVFADIHIRITCDQTHLQKLKEGGGKKRRGGEDEEEDDVEKYLGFKHKKSKKFKKGDKQHDK